MSLSNMLVDIKKLLLKAEGEITQDTISEYTKAYNSLTNELQSLSTLPCDNSYYDTLVHLGYVERKTEQLYKYRSKMPRGFRIYFKLK